MSTAPRLDVVIVSYNVADYLVQCLYAAQAAAAHYGADHVTLWVVDNASTDDSVAQVQARFPQARCIANAENVGFARANNQAIAAGSGDYILLLNPDTFIAESALSQLVTFAEADPARVAVGPQLIDGHGQFSPESKRSLPTPWAAFYKLFGLARLFPQHPALGRYHATHLSADHPQQVEVLSGACQLLRRSAFEAVGGFDARYFMFGEDVDLSYRLMQAGGQSWYLPAATVLHYKGRSSRRRGLAHVWRFYRAMFQFVRQHYSGRVNALWYAAIWLGIALRGLLAAVGRVGLPGLELLLFVLLAEGLAFGYARWLAAPGAAVFPQPFYTVVAPVYAALYVLGLYLAGAFRRPYRVREVVWGIGAGFAAISALSYFVPALRYSRAVVLLLTLVAGTLALANRRLLPAAIRRMLGLGFGTPHRVALAAAAPAGVERLMALLPALRERLDPVATYTGAELDALVARLALLRPEAVLVALDDLAPEHVIAWRKALAPLGIALFTYAAGGQLLIGADRALQLRQPSKS